MKHKLDLSLNGQTVQTRYTNTSKHFKIIQRLKNQNQQHKYSSAKQEKEII